MKLTLEMDCVVWGGVLSTLFKVEEVTTRRYGSRTVWSGGGEDE